MKQTAGRDAAGTGGHAATRINVASPSSSAGAPAIASPLSKKLRLTLRSPAASVRDVVPTVPWLRRVCPTGGPRRVLHSQWFATIYTLLAAYQVLAAPVMIAFDWRPSHALFIQSSFFVGLDVFALVFFSVDIVVKLLVTDWTQRSDPFVGCPSAVARRYVFSRKFWLDFAATMPWARVVEAACAACRNDLVGAAVLDCADTPSSAFPDWDTPSQWARLLLLSRLLRLPSLNQLFASWAMEAGPGARLGHLAWIILLLCHMFGCGVFFLAELERHDGTWTQADCLHTEDSTLADRYLTSVYLAATTTSTVGFGDLPPTTTLERGMFTLMVLVGSALFAFAIGRIAVLTRDLRADHHEHEQQLDELNTFLKGVHLPAGLAYRLRTYAIDSGCRTAPYEKILSRVSTKLRNEVESVVVSRSLANTPLLVGMSPAVLREVVKDVRLVWARPHQVLCPDDDVAAEVFVVVVGVCELARPGGGGDVVIREGGCMGLEQALSGQRYGGSLRAGPAQNTLVAAVSVAGARRIAGRHPQFGAHLRALTAAFTPAAGHEATGAGAAGQSAAAESKDMSAL